MGSWLANKIISGVVSWFVGVVVGALNTLWKLLSDTVLQSPDVTKLPQVDAFASTSLGVVNAVYVLAFLLMAIMVMGRGTIQSRYGPGELIPRLILGLILANFALPMCSTIIGLANALTDALTSDPISSKGTLSYLQSTSISAISSDSGGNPAAFLAVLIGLVVAILVGMMFMQWIIRLGLLIVVVGIAPLAVALHATPQTEGAAKLWWRTLLGTLGTVVMQAVALHTTLKVFLSPNDNLALLGLPAVGTGDVGAVLNLLIVVCMLLGVLKIPGLMRRYVTKSRPGISGQLFRLVVVQQITRGLSKGLSKGLSRAGSATRQPAPVGRTTGWPTR